MTSYYDLLGVTVDADVDEIHRAYLRQAQQLHPDRFAGAPEADRARAEAAMKALNEAWNTLKNADARHLYDAELPWSELEATPAPPSLFRRTAVRLVIVVLLVAGLAGSGIAIFAGARPDRPPAPSGRTAAAWNPSDVAALRAAAIRAGLGSTEADCFVTYITSRYRPSDRVDPADIQRGIDSCR